MKRQMTNAPPGPGTAAADILWQKIQQFPLDDPEAHYPFSRKLAKENKWDQPFTDKAIAEYRKFLWLCCISPHGASPSAVIDQVWHLHLLYTKNYWEDFCAQTIQRHLHHHPSSGGPVQRDRHEAWQTDTLRLYRTFFQSEPPPDIWIDRPQPGQKGNRFQRLARKITGLFILLPILLLSSCGVSDFAGPVLFVLFIGLISAIRGPGSPEQPRRKKDGEHGSSGSSGGSCGSSCSSSCSSSCGSGCGGCGGGGD